MSRESAAEDFGEIRPFRAVGVLRYHRDHVGS